MDNKRLITFFVVAVVTVMVWGFAMDRRYPGLNQPPVVASAPAASSPSASVASVVAGGVPGATSPADVGKLPHHQRIKVQTDLFSAEIDSSGADLRQLSLLKHGQDNNPKQPYALLMDSADRTFVAQTGLLGEGLPTHNSEFKAEKTAYQLADGQNEVAVRLEAAEAGGVKVAKTYVFKRGSYVVDVKYEIINGSGKPLNASAYYRFMRDDHQDSSGAMGGSSFTGPAVYTEESRFQKLDFSKVAEGKASYVEKSKDGWVAMLQHYFATAWLVSPKGFPAICGAGSCRYSVTKLPNGLFSAGVITDLPQLAAGARFETNVPLFLGPKETTILEQAAPGLELVKDYGMSTVIATPLHALLNYLYSLVGNWGWAIILLTVIIKACLYPLAAKSYRSMGKMRELAPRVEELKQRHGDDKMKQQQAMMELYKQEKVNPLGGCLPMFVQIPVFFALYATLNASVELRQAHWLGWIVDLSMKDPYYILPLLLAVSMFLQTRFSPPPADPTQAKMMKFMPVVMSVLFINLPAGLALYYVVNNSLSILQQWVNTRNMDKSVKLAKS